MYQALKGRSTANFPTVDLKKKDVVKKTLLYIQKNHAIEKPDPEKAETEQNLKKA